MKNKDLMITSMNAYSKYVGSNIENVLNKQTYIETMNYIKNRVEVATSGHEIYLEIYKMPTMETRWYNFTSNPFKYQNLAKTHARDIISSINQRFT